ncbi:MAG: twin-arginine translocation signal domain-containing protein, partial [Terriglobia bacterium]
MKSEMLSGEGRAFTRREFLAGVTTAAVLAAAPIDAAAPPPVPPADQAATASASTDPARQATVRVDVAHATNSF